MNIKNKADGMTASQYAALFVRRVTKNLGIKEKTRDHSLVVEECCSHLNVCETLVRIENGWL